MEETKSESMKADKKATIKRKNVLKKLDPETAKLLQTLKDKANKKSYGRKVADSAILAKALSLVDTNHIQELQELSLSEKDKLHIAHETFQKQNGKISLDQFIGRLLKANINPA